jgi:PD-(D/E)XK nuclease superfamily
MRLSQSHLSLLETCPRQFQHQILEQLSLQSLGGQDWAGEQEARLRSGSEFHQLVQQRSLSLPIEVLLADASPLQTWFRAFERAEPDLFTATEAWGFAESEHVRTLAMLGHSLVVVYDYVVLESERALILDWKTYGKPDSVVSIVESWQSRLYLYVLSRTSHYPPEHIAMRYWFFNRDGIAQPLDLSYSDAKQADIDRRLTALLTQFNQWLTDYTQENLPFPQTPQWDTCDRCAYAVRCGRSRLNPLDSPLDLAWGEGSIAWDAIPEIS